jgi:hypothetical protein
MLNTKHVQLLPFAPCDEGEDEHGPYVRLDLANSRGPLAGRSVIISPEDADLREGKWQGGFRRHAKHPWVLVVSQQKRVHGESTTTLLSRVIGVRICILDPNEGKGRVYKQRTLGDYRRDALAPYAHVCGGFGLRGVRRCNDRLRVSVPMPGGLQIVGHAGTLEEARHMYNHALMAQKTRFPEDMRIQQTPFQ